MVKYKLLKGERYGWHFLEQDMTLRCDGRKVTMGKRFCIPNTVKPSCCGQGMHATDTVNAPYFRNYGPILCRVVVGGDIDTQEDKFAGGYRRVLWYWDTKEVPLYSDDFRRMARKPPEGAVLATAAQLRQPKPKKLKPRKPVKHYCETCTQHLATPKALQKHDLNQGNDRDDDIDNYRGNW